MHTDRAIGCQGIQLRPQVIACFYQAFRGVVDDSLPAQGDRARAAGVDR